MMCFDVPLTLEITRRGMEGAEGHPKGMKFKQKNNKGDTPTYETKNKNT